MPAQAAKTIMANGTLHEGKFSCPVIVTIMFSENTSEPIRFRVLPDLDNKSDGERFGPIEIRGTTELGKSFRILDFYRESTTTHHSGTESGKDTTVWEGTCNIYMEGNLGTVQLHKGQFICSIYTSPNPLTRSNAQFVLSEDGTIRLEDTVSGGSLTWNTCLGKAKLLHRYRYSEDDIGLDKATIRVRRSVLELEAIESDVELSVGDLFSKLPSVFDETFWLISFLSRRRVVWYEVETIFIPNDKEDEYIQHATAQRRQWFGFGTDSALDRFAIVYPENLQDDLFQQLLSNYLKSPYQEVIRQAIILILVSYERGYIEFHYPSVYTAFEALVFGLDQDRSISHLIGSSRFKKLRAKLEHVICDELSDDEVINATLQKLPELRRRPFIDQLRKHLEYWALDISILWPEGADIDKELRDLINRRNIYLHQGKMESASTYVRDLERIRALVELWILKLLECPDEAINPVEFSHLRHK